MSFGIGRLQQTLGLLVACLGGSSVVLSGCSRVLLHAKAGLITLTQEQQSSVILKKKRIKRFRETFYDRRTHAVHNVAVISVQRVL